MRKSRLEKRSPRPLDVASRVACGLLLLATFGCGGSQTIAEGGITLDGQPLDRGYITFRPQPGEKGPVVGGPVEKGKYVLRGAELPGGGKYRVEITASGPTGRKQLDDSGRPVDAEGQILPAKYNQRTQLQAELKPGGPNKFDFTVTSK